MGHRLGLFILICWFSTSCGYFVRPIAGASSKRPTEMKEGLSKEAHELVERALAGLEGDPCFRDIHVHLAGLGTGGTGIEINPTMRSWMHFYKRIQYEVYMSAAGIQNPEQADQEYMARLVALMEGAPGLGKTHLLAFDRHYDRDGQYVPEKTSLYVPNEYVWEMASQRPDLFVPTISVHPYRKDALTELEKWGAQGVRFIKWLPNSMNIDPSDPGLDPFYELIKKHNMVLLTHTGEEKAVEGEEHQHLGNPLLLRRPLGMGVKIVMAHLASLGQCKDLENGNQPASCFELFWRLFEDDKYRDNLFGEISAITLYTRVGRPLDKIFESENLQTRLVNGSDYPLPAINLLFRTGQFEKLGHISAAERKLLNEIYDYNPLLFDLVLKRTLKHPQTGKRLSDRAFLLPPALCGHQKT